MKRAWVYVLAGIVGAASIPFGAGPAGADVGPGPDNDNRDHAWSDWAPQAVTIDLSDANRDGAASACGAPAGGDIWWNLNQ